MSARLRERGYCAISGARRARISSSSVCSILLDGLDRVRD